MRIGSCERDGRFARTFDSEGHGDFLNWRLTLAEYLGNSDSKLDFCNGFDYVQDNKRYWDEWKS